MSITTVLAMAAVGLFLIGLGAWLKQADNSAREAASPAQDLEGRQLGTTTNLALRIIVAGAVVLLLLAVHDRDGDEDADESRDTDEQARDTGLPFRVHVEAIEPVDPCLEGLDPEIRDTAILELADRARRNELYGWPIRQTEVDRAGVESPALHLAIYPGEPPYQGKFGFAVTLTPEGWAIGRRILIGLGLTEDEALAMAATCLEQLEALPRLAG